MTREEFYKSNRGERDYYKSEFDLDEDILLPVTFDGFEALLEMAADHHELPIDDRLRSLLAGYIHHIPSDEPTLNLGKLVAALYKSYSNSMTYDIDQQAKKRAVDAAGIGTITLVKD